ncbi:MAG: hypothetical protein ACYC3U_13355, partial [Georgenia sp.]
MTDLGGNAPGSWGGVAGALGVGTLGVALLAGAGPAPLTDGPDAPRVRDAVASVSRAGQREPIELGRLGDLRIQLAAPDGTWTVNGTEVDLDTYRLVPGAVLTYSADVGVHADEPAVAALSARATESLPASVLVTHLGVDVDGGAVLGDSTVVALDGEATVRVSLDVAFGPGAVGRTLQGATLAMPEVVVRVQPAGTGLIEGVVTLDGAPAPGATVLIEAQGAGAFAPVCDPVLVDGHANPKTTGKAGTFDWPVVDGTYRITAVSGARVASDVVRVLGRH